MSLRKDKLQVQIFALPILIIISSVFLALSPLLHNNSKLAMGITYDLTLTAPIIYFLLIRKKKIPVITVVPVFILGIILTSLLLPTNQHFHLEIIKSYILPIVEITVVLVILYHVFKTVRAYKEISKSSYDFYIVLKESAIKSIGFPKIAKILATEIAIVYYGIFSWKRAATLSQGFTNYKENGITAMLGVVLFLILIETCILHFFLLKWNETVAWIISISSIYAALQIFSHIKALKQRTSEIIDGHLYLKYGLFGDVKVNLQHISEIKLTSNNIVDKNRLVEKLALLKDLENHNVVIYFIGRHKVEKAYGITRECDTLLLHIDNKQEFKNAIDNALKEGK